MTANLNTIHTIIRDRYKSRSTNEEMIEIYDKKRDSSAIEGAEHCSRSTTKNDNFTTSPAASCPLRPPQLTSPIPILVTSKASRSSRERCSYKHKRNTSHEKNNTNKINIEDYRIHLSKIIYIPRHHVQPHHCVLSDSPPVELLGIPLQLW